MNHASKLVYDTLHVLATAAAADLQFAEEQSAAKRDRMRAVLDAMAPMLDVHEIEALYKEIGLDKTLIRDQAQDGLIVFDAVESLKEVISGLSLPGAISKEMRKAQCSKIEMVRESLAEHFAE